MPSATTYPIISWGKEFFQPIAMSEYACEFIWTMQPGGAVPEHHHQECDEHFEVLEGEVVFTIAGKKRTARAGETITVPRMTPHSPANKSAADCRCRVWFTPAVDQAKFFKILFFLKERNVTGMAAVIRAMYISDRLGYREFSTVTGAMKVLKQLIMGSFKLAAPFIGWNKLAQRYSQSL